MRRYVPRGGPTQQDFLRIYQRGLLEPGAWGSQAVNVDARVEDEWNNIYVECQDCLNGESTTTATGSGATGSAQLRRMYLASRNVAERASSPPSSSSSESSTRDYLAFNEPRGQADGGEEDGEMEGNAHNTQGEKDDIIDCAIRGRWSFTDNDDQVSSCMVLCVSLGDGGIESGGLSSSSPGYWQ